MKDLGTIRKLDELGRITIPKEFRDAQGLKEDQTMEIFISGNDLIIKPYIMPGEKVKALEWLSTMLQNSKDKEMEELVRSTIGFLRRA